MRKPYQLAIVITGSRKVEHGYAFERLIAEKLAEHSYAFTVVIEGGATGVDRAAREIAKKQQFQVLTAWANWERSQKAAGPIRNSFMINLAAMLADEVEVLAFHPDVASSKGTVDCMTKAQERGLAVHFFDRP